MKTTKTLLSAAVLALSLTRQVQAEEEPIHTVGLQVGGGGIDYKGKTLTVKGLVNHICIITTSFHLIIT